MWNAGRAASRIYKQPGAFALAVLKQFRANQGVLLAGAVAYYTLLSLVPLLILILLALSHVVPEDRLLLTLSEYLEFVVPGQSTAVVAEVRTFLAQKQVIGSILFVTMLFFSALAFTILENAMSVIFYLTRPRTFAQSFIGKEGQQNFAFFADQAEESSPCLLFSFFKIDVTDNDCFDRRVFNFGVGLCHGHSVNVE